MGAARWALTVLVAAAWLCATLGDGSDRSNNISYASNHSFVFISGWPQSGTSFMHQVIESSSLVSSMIQKCEERLGKRCISWNHEGQWILKGSTRMVVKSGQVVPILRFDSQTAASIREEWSQFWDLRSPVLVEKSPQSFLKIPAFHDAFRDSPRQRFLIVIKHPVTLNIATPRNAGWKYYRNTEVPVVKDLSTTLISPSQKMENIQHFIKLMTLNDTGPDGSLGWIPAMERLVSILSNHSQYLANSVRVVRYEQFARPLPTCQAVFNFVFGSTEKHDGRKSCADLFLTRQGASVSTSSEQGTPFRSSKHSRSSQSGRTTHPRRLQDIPEAAARIPFTEQRSLRLRTGQGKTSLQFRPELVTEMGRKRMTEYWEMVKSLPRGLQDELYAIDKKLRLFGYSLYEEFVRDKANALSPWELSPNGK